MPIKTVKHFKTIVVDTKLNAHYYA